MKMRKPDIMAVVTIAVLASVVVTMFFQDIEPMSSARADVASYQSIHQSGWGNVRVN